jgi:hypothetical protein
LAPIFEVKFKKIPAFAVVLIPQKIGLEKWQIGLNLKEPGAL